MPRRSMWQTAPMNDALRRIFQPDAGSPQVAGPDAGSPQGDGRDVGKAAQGATLDVVDLGGGTGGLAVSVAELGHRVTVVDPSPNALAALARRAAEAGVTSSVRAILGDAATLPELVGAASADVVVCHGVLEVVDDPVQALDAVATLLRGGGRLSVLAAQRSGTVFARVLGGHVEEAAAVLRADPDAIPRSFTLSRLEELLAGAGFSIDEVRGVRIFADSIDSRVVDAQPGAAARLGEMEAAVCTAPDFMPFATQLHLLASRPRAG